MIRKYIILALLGTLGSIIAAKAFTLSMTVNGNTMTNLAPLTQGSAYIKQLAIANSSTSNSVTFQLVDSYTNSYTYTNAAYTNMISYATNRIFITTNFYGGTNNLTNLSLVDVTNAVPITTNNFPVRATVSALAGTTAQFNNLNAYFSSGIWVSNLSASNAVITVSGNFGE